MTSRKKEERSRRVNKRRMLKDDQSLSDKNYDDEETESESETEAKPKPQRHEKEPKPRIPEAGSKGFMTGVVNEFLSSAEKRLANIDNTVIESENSIKTAADKIVKLKAEMKRSCDVIENCRPDKEWLEGLIDMMKEQERKYNA